MWIAPEQKQVSRRSAIAEDRPTHARPPCGAAILESSLANASGIVNGVFPNSEWAKFPLRGRNNEMSGFGDVFLSPSGDAL